MSLELHQPAPEDTLESVCLELSDPKRFQMALNRHPVFGPKITEATTRALSAAVTSAMTIDLDQEKGAAVIDQVIDAAWESNSVSFGFFAQRLTQLALLIGRSDLSELVVMPGDSSEMDAAIEEAKKRLSADSELSSSMAAVAMKGPIARLVACYQEMVGEEAFMKAHFEALQTVPESIRGGAQGIAATIISTLLPLMRERYSSAEACNVTVTSLLSLIAAARDSVNIAMTPIGASVEKARDQLLAETVNRAKSAPMMVELKEEANPAQAESKSAKIFPFPSNKTLH